MTESDWATCDDPAPSAGRMIACRSSTVGRVVKPSASAFTGSPPSGRIHGMEAIIRKVRDIEEHERHVLEHVVGRQLHENQQVVIQIETLDAEPSQSAETTGEPDVDELPDWCNVFEGLTDDQIADLDAAIRERANFTRPS